MKRNILIVRALLGMSLATAAVGATAETQPALAAIVSLDIKSQPMTAALNEFGRQTGLQVLFYSDVADGVKKAPALTGAFTPEEALTQLLSNTGLMYSYINARTVAIHRAVSNVSESETRREPERPVMRLANDVRMVETRGEQVGQGAADGEGLRREDASSDTRRNTRVDEIIVTARKRAENIHDVPMSISAISADEISRRGLVGAADYLRGIPGVNQTDQFTGQTIVIRGLETSPAGQNFGSGVTVATYFGETPTTNSAGLVNDTNVDIKLVDIERVEVLRGPQGTAFGSSSLGGAVRTIPVAPKLDRFEGSVGLGFSATGNDGGDNFSAQAVGNLPVVRDRLGVRVAAYKFKDSGFYRNVAGTDEALQTSVIARYGAPDIGVSRDEVGTTEVEGARISASLQATEDLNFSLIYMTQDREMNGFGVANRPGYTQALPLVAPEHVVRGSREPRADTRIELINATAEYDLQWADLLVTYSYVDSGATRSFPYVGFNFLYPASNIGTSPHDERSGEVRLATKLQGTWNFLVGLYYEKLKDDYTRSDYWHGDPALNPFVPGQRFLGEFRDQREKEQRAAFGEVSWEFLPNFTLTGGARFYDHDRTYRRTNSGFLYGSTPVASDASVSDSTYRANLSYKLNDDALVYADWSQGFRLGNPQAGLAIGTCDRNNDGIVDGTAGTTIASTRELEPDSLDSFELGAKLAFLDQRLTTSASLFRIEWDGLPFRVVAPLPPAGCGSSYVTNASKATSEGVELQANIQVTPDFRAELAGSWLRARLTQDSDNIIVGGVPARAGDRLPGAPRVNASLGLQYDFSIFGRMTQLRSDSVYVGTYYDTIKPLANFKAGGYVKIDLSARVMVNDAFSVEAFVRNLTNEDDFTFRDVIDLGPFFGYRMRPRTVGVQLGVNF